MPALSPGKLIACLALLFCMAPGQGQGQDQAQDIDMQGSWGLRLLDPQKKLLAEATLQFSGDAAKSCMRGKWKRVAVTPKDGTDTAFFPLGDALAYKLERGVLTIGQVTNCHRFLLLSATASATDTHGTYKAVSVGRSRQLGLFTLRPMP